MDDAKLIDLLKANEVLYNKMHPLANADYKKEVWEEVAAEVGFPVERVIARYRTLRDRFVRYKRSLITRGPQNNYDLVIMDKMEFLAPFIFIKTKSGRITWEGNEPNLNPSKDPLNVPPSSMMLDDTMTLPTATKSARRTRRKVAKIEDESSMDVNDTTSFNSINVEAESPTAANYDSSDTANHTDSDDDYFCAAIDSFKRLCQSQQNVKRKENEALDGFRKMIIATISKMNISKQTKAMLLVTEAVMQIKMEDEY